MNEKARSLLGEFGRATAAEPPPARLESIWSGVTDARPTRRWWPVVAVAAAAVVAVVAARSPSERPIEAAAKSAVEAPKPGVALKKGQTVHGQITFLVTEAAAWVEETEKGTVLFVESGEVQWRTRTRSGVAHAGERIVLNDEAAEPPPLTAEASLYERAIAAQPAQRLSLLRAVRQKFPDGAFAPEVAIGLMKELDAAGQRKEAADEARAFLTRFPSDPRAASVKQWLGSRR